MSLPYPSLYFLPSLSLFLYIVLFTRCLFKAIDRVYKLPSLPLQLKLSRLCHVHGSFSVFHFILPSFPLLNLKLLGFIRRAVGRGGGSEGALVPVDQLGKRSPHWDMQAPYPAPLGASPCLGDTALLSGMPKACREILLAA